MREEDEDGESVTTSGTTRTREISAATINAVTRTRETRGAGESDSETKGELDCFVRVYYRAIYIRTETNIPRVDARRKVEIKTSPISKTE